jgi:hypothetical protein
MSGRHEDRAHAHVGLRWIVATAALLTLLLSFAAVGPASAATRTDDAQISLTGLVDESNPTGGSQLGVHPGDSVRLSASAAPTAKVKSLANSLGLGSLLSSLLSTVDFQVRANFAGLPGGANNTVLSGSKNVTFKFPKAGTYRFSWQAEKVSVGLLGKSIVPIELNGNQLKRAGLELNASNSYVGQIVVAKNPPKGGISVQLPGVTVAPKLPVVGKLPKVGLPGVTLPTVPVTVPDLNPTKGTGKTGTKAKPSAASSGPGLTYTPPGLTIPDMVVPKGSSGQGGSVGQDVLADGSNGLLPDSAVNGGGGGGGKAALGGQSQDLPAYNPGNNNTIELASEAGTPSSQVPVILAILAIIALALVAGTYARLFLLKKQS